MKPKIQILIALAMLILAGTNRLQPTSAHDSETTDAFPFAETNPAKALLKVTNATAGPVAYYSFDDGSATDHSGNQNDGTVHGNPEAAPGANGQGMSFEGYYDPDYVVVPNSPSLSFLDDFTISLWFNLRDNTSQDSYGNPSEYGAHTFLGKSGDRNGIVVKARRSTADGLWYPYVKNGQCGLTGGCGPDSVALRVPDGNGVNLHEWHMFSVTHGEGAVQLYLDGNLQTQMDAVEFNLNPLMIEKPIYIGAELSGSGAQTLWFPAAAVLDEILIYNRPLNEAEIRQLFESVSLSSSISGHVRDDRGDPVANATISIDSGSSTTTDASGAYTIASLDADIYTLTPTLDGHRFAPITRTVEVPPNATADFIARPAIPARFLTLPVPFTDFTLAARGNVDGTGPALVNSWFDHSRPDYRADRALIRWDAGTHFGGPEVLGPVDCETGVACYDGHNGIDFQNMRSVCDTNNHCWTDPVYAAAPGVVVEEGWNDSYGNYVMLDHENGYATFYAHLASVDDEIQKGKRITDTRSVQLGLMGNTGSGSKGTHLHFALYYDADGDREWEEEYGATRYTEAVDPYGWLRSLADFDPWHIPSFYLWEETLGMEYTAGASEVMLGSASGNAVVTIPEGALSSETTFELWEVPSAAFADSDFRPSGLSILLWSPDWLSSLNAGPANSLSWAGFAQPITVTMSYTDAEIAHLDETGVTVYHRSSSSEPLVPLATSVDTGRNEATVQITDAGYFSLQAPLACPADAQEPDDGYSASGMTSTDGVPQRHLFDTAQDEDWVRFAASPGISCTIRTADLAEGVDTVVEVYDIDGVTLLASDDNSGGAKDSYLEWIPPANGTYFVRVSQAPGSSYGCDAAFSLSVQQDKRLYLPLVLRRSFGQ